MFHLAPHSHTGKLLPHHHTSYHGLLLLLVVVGLAMASVQHVAHADYLAVSAKVSAVTPTVAAVIVSPVDGSNAAEPIVTLHGNCQYLQPAAIISVYRGGSFLGSTSCQSNGHFAVDVTLVDGLNQLLARTANSTGDYGPDSLPVTVSYTPVTADITLGADSQPPDATSAGTTAHTDNTNHADDSPQAPIAGPLQIRSQDTYLQFGPGSAAVWRFAVAGGSAPYQVSVDWGDGQSSAVSASRDAGYELRHSYQLFRSGFAHMTVSDATGVETEFTIAVFTPAVTLPGTDAATGMSQDLSLSDFVRTIPGQLVIEYVAYVGALSLLGLAWYDASVAPLRIAGVHIFPQQPAARPSRMRRPGKTRR